MAIRSDLGVDTPTFRGEKTHFRDRADRGV